MPVLSRGGDPLLDSALSALNDAGIAGEVWDADWRSYALSNDYAVVIAAGREVLDFGLGLHFLSPELTRLRESWPAGPTRGGIERLLERCGGAMATASPGGLESWLEHRDSDFIEVVQGLQPTSWPAVMTGRIEIIFGRETLLNDVVIIPIRRQDGSFAGAVFSVKPAMSASVLAMLALGDERLFQRMLSIIRPQQRPGAILFGDLESSSTLARRLSSAAFFSLVRRLSYATDSVIVDAGGIVGKHAGDGVTAFFLSEELGSDSAAARAAIESARAIGPLTATVAARSGLSPDAVIMRFGLHWGASLYIGRLLTSGRLEVTGFCDEVNEGARIESSAVGGLRLASKPLLERLGVGDAKALDLDPALLSYTPLGELPGAGEKAIRDAGTIAVCAV